MIFLKTTLLKNKKGYLIVFYGPNNIGKSTQIQLTKKYLHDKKYPIKIIKYPIYEIESGQVLNAILRPGNKKIENIVKTLLQKRYKSNHIHKILLKIQKALNNFGYKSMQFELELQKLFTQNRHDYENELQNMLDNGITVIAEDYVGTGIAWGMTRGIAFEKLAEMNKGLLEPDIAIMLIAENRFTQSIEQKAKHRNETDELAWQKNKEIYKKLAKKFNWHVINIDKHDTPTKAVMYKTPEAIQKEIQDILNNQLNIK